MRKRVAYVVGPYRAPTVQGIVSNIRKAEAVARKLWSDGYAVICPHKNTALLDGFCDDKVWLDGGIEIMKRCDLVVCVPGWEFSEGSVKEVKEASNVGLCVYELDQEGLLVRIRLEKQAERKTLHRLDADAEMYALLKDFCRFSPATDPHEIAALQSKALMLLEEIEEAKQCEK